MAVKKHVPFARANWHRDHRALIEIIASQMDRIELGECDDQPWIEEAATGVRFYGFATDKKSSDLFEMLQRALPDRLPRSHLRIMRDYVTRYLYPHLRPDLKPEGYALEALSGFHGQHKDAIADLPDDDTRNRLLSAFAPSSTDVVIDGGAFLGMGALRFSKDAPGARVIAVEANRDCYDRLARNVSYNNAGAVTPLHGALWNTPGSLDLQVGDAQANSLLTEVVQSERSQKVDTLTVDGIVEHFGLTKLTMLSLTINGAEIEALAGARKALQAMKPRVRLAGWYKRDGIPVWRLARDYLKELDYEVFVGPRGSVTAVPKQ